MATDPVFLTIRQIDGSNGVTLQGSDLPVQLPRGGKLRSVSTFYPGRSTRSRQILGTSEDDIVLTGEFRDVWTGLDGGALAQYAALRTLLLGQLRCELAWGEQVVCRGYVEAVEQTFDRVSVIGYRLTFGVDESDEAVVIAPVLYQPRTAADLTKTLDELEALAEAALVAALAIDVIAGVV